MGVLIAVLRDFYRFVFVYWFGFAGITDDSKMTSGEKEHTTQISDTREDKKSDTNEVLLIENTHTTLLPNMERAALNTPPYQRLKLLDMHVKQKRISMHFRPKHLMVLLRKFLTVLLFKSIIDRVCGTACSMRNCEMDLRRFGNRKQGGS